MKKIINKISEKTVMLMGNTTLLVFLIMQFFIIPMFPETWHRQLFSVVITLIYLNVVVLLKDYRTSLLSYVIFLIIIDLVLAIMGLMILSQVLYLLNIVLFVFVIVNFIILIAKSKNVNVNVILDSINGYLLLGLLSTMMINLVMSFNPESFTFNVEAARYSGVSRISEFQYYGLVTLTTLGYGEITPVSPAARSVATLIAVSGQLYVAIILALLVGKFAGQVKKEE